MVKFRNLSKNEKIKFGLLITASAILVIVLIANYKKSYKPIQVKEADRKETLIIREAKEPKKKKVRKKKPAEIEALLQKVGRKDPFLPPSGKYIPPESSHAELNLAGIIWDAEKPLAIINDTIVGEGDMIGDKKVIKIEKESVIVVQEDGKKYILKLRGFDSRKEGE